MVCNELGAAATTVHMSKGRYDIELLMCRKRNPELHASSDTMRTGACIVTAMNCDQDIHHSRLLVNEFR